MRVEQFLNKNQFHIIDYNNNIDYLQSYNSLVVKIKIENQNTEITLGCDWDYSTTTSKHVYKFLEEFGNISFDDVLNKRAYVKKLIEDGIIKYDNDMC